MALNNAKEICKVIDSDRNNWLFISLDFDEFLDDIVIDRLRHEVPNEGTQKADLVMLLGESPNEGTETFIDTKVHSWDFVWYRNVHETIRHTSGKKYKELKIYKPALPYKYFHYQDLTKKRNYYELLKKGFEKDPTDIKTSTYLCWEAILHNDYEGLEKYVNQLLSNIIASKYDDLYGDTQYSIQAYKYLSILYKHTGEKAKRINALRNAIHIAITNFHDIRILHHMLADAYWSTDDKDSAIKEYEAELEIKEYRDCWVDDKSLYKSGEVYSKLSTAYYYIDDICNSIYYGVYATKVEPNNQLYKKNLDSIVKGFRSKIISDK
jgi:tetratricopeptide (TPR) repeat protein